MFKQYFAGSTWFSAIGIVLAGVIGYFYGGVQLAGAYVFSAFLLSVLEVCVSFDNAIVNVTVLRNMDAKWQHRFLTWGMLIAVFGMRLVFPILIVGIAGHIPSFVNWTMLFSGNVVESFTHGTALSMALTDPAAYQATLTSAHTQIMGFGGTFLLMVFLAFFLDENKEHHWIGFIEKHLTTIGRINSVQAAVAVTTLLVISPMMHESDKFFVSGLIGLISYILVKGSEAFLGVDGVGTKAGAAAFIYLEVLDASFSFDGVIAAFAITNNILIIMIGLGVGAFWVRSLTIYMNEKGTLNALTYLEHGAFWAIGFLVAIMYISAAGIELGELVTAGGSLAIIFAAFIHSLAVKDAEGTKAHAEQLG